MSKLELKNLPASIQDRLANQARHSGRPVNLEVPDDGIQFDPATVTGERIHEDAEYEGVRLRFSGLLGRARLHLQIDVGFGDVVSPAPVLKVYPAILSMPAPELRSYPPETMAAEKLQVMIYLGSVNSRMKDFYDLWTISEQFDFKGVALQEAIHRTFEHRGTEIPVVEPVAFSAQFAHEKQAQWTAFLRTSTIAGAPENMEIILARLREFILPIFESILAGRKFRKIWKPSRRSHAGWVIK